MDSPLNLGPLVDHHCHGLIEADLDRKEYESLMNEAAAPSPLGTSFFDSMLGLAIRRWCAPALDLEPHAPADSYLERRAELGAGEVNRRLLTAAGISTFLVDTGLEAERMCSPGDLATMAGGTAHEVVRLEAVAQQILAAGGRQVDFPERLEAAVRESEAVGAKSIAAYRVGLRLPAARPSTDDLLAAIGQIQPDATGRYRIAHPVVNAWLAWTAVDLGMPLQFHVGYGDNDVDLADCDPLCLTAFLRASEERSVPVLLLHNYPFHRHAAYLAQVFSHVFMDLGLAVHNTGALSQAMIRESLELVPFGKLLFSSDAFGLAELYYLAASLFRRGMAAVLTDLLDADEMSAADARRVCSLVARDNARRAYRLEDTIVAG